MKAFPDIYFNLESTRRWFHDVSTHGVRRFCAYVGLESLSDKGDLLKSAVTSWNSGRPKIPAFLKCLPLFCVLIPSMSECRPVVHYVRVEVLLDGAKLL